MVARADCRSARAGRIGAQHQSQADRIASSTARACAGRSCTASCQGPRRRADDAISSVAETRSRAARSIHERPRAVETREQFGHWEGDLMQFRFAPPSVKGRPASRSPPRCRTNRPRPPMTPSRRSSAHCRNPPVDRSPSTTAANSPSMRTSTPSWRRKPTSATLIPLGSAAPSKTPTASSAATCPEKPTFTTTPPATSTQPHLGHQLNAPKIPRLQNTR